jgi:O-antigen/teichoic acid export membrane protein
MSGKERIVKDVLKFTSARSITQGIGFFTAIALRKFLGPFYMGIWSLLKVVLGYASHSTLIMNKGAAVKIPLHSGEGDREAEDNVKNIVFTFILVVSVLTSLALLIASVVLRQRYPVVVIVGLVALSFYMFLDNLCSFYQMLLRAKHNFSVLSKAIIFEAIINLTLIMLLVRKFELYGLYITLIITALLNLIFMHLFAGYKVKLIIDKKKLLGLWEIFRTSIPIVLVSLLYWVLGTLDRIMIGKMIGIAFVGFYSIPVMTKAYVGQLSSFGTVLYPRLMEAYGEKKSAKEIEKYVIVPIRINAYILPSVLGAVFFIVPLLVRKILPEYIPGILAMQILLIGIFFETCRAQSFFFIIALKKQAKVIPIAVIAIGLNVLGNYILIKMGYGIYGVAAATAFVSFLSFLGIQIYAMRHFAMIKDIIGFLVEIIIPLIYTAVVALFLERFLATGNVYYDVICKSLGLTFSSVPLFLYIQKRTGIISLLYGMFLQKIMPARGDNGKTL